jgi:hypothetical protein
MKTLFSSLSFLLALLLSLFALYVFFQCILPWREAPDRTHEFFFFAGMQFTGWQLLIPFAGFAVGAMVAGLFGLWILKRRS